MMNKNPLLNLQITMPLLYEEYPYQKCKEHLIKLRDFLTNNDL